MYGVVFPKNPYIGQIFYDASLKRTFEYVEKDFLKVMVNRHTDWCEWKDITDELK
tara:strand:- start:1116 stop:1280 length:165 start_codon:yes stop_codon:yes gene_type:complete